MRAGTVRRASRALAPARAGARPIAVGGARVPVRRLSKFWNERFVGKHRMAPRWEEDVREDIVERHNWGYLQAEVRDQIWYEWSQNPTDECMDEICKQLQLSKGTVRAVVNMQRHIHEMVKPGMTEDEVRQGEEDEVFMEALHYKWAIDFLHNHPAMTDEDKERIPELLRYREEASKLDASTYDAKYYYDDDGDLPHESTVAKHAPASTGKTGPTRADVEKRQPTFHHITKEFEEAEGGRKPSAKDLPDAASVPLPEDEDMAWRNEKVALEVSLAAAAAAGARPASKAATIVFRDTSAGAGFGPVDVKVKEPGEALREGTREEELNRSWVPKRPSVLSPAEFEGYSRHLQGRQGRAGVRKQWPGLSRRNSDRAGL